MTRTLRSLSSKPVSLLESVSERQAGALASLGVETVLDLVTYYPYRYEDRTKTCTLGEMVDGEMAWVPVRVETVTVRRIRGGRVFVDLVVRDAEQGETGTATASPDWNEGPGDSDDLLRLPVELRGGAEVMTVRFFNQPWRAKQLKVGMGLWLYGQSALFRGRLQLTNPLVEPGDPFRGKGSRLAAARIVPIYAASDKRGISSMDFERFIAEALDRAGEVADPLPERTRRRLKLPARSVALRQVHQPPGFMEVSLARKRLAFEELLWLQAHLVASAARSRRGLKGIAHVVGQEHGARLVENFLAGLPYELTGAQLRALDEIGRDMASTLPMHRLLQGDVGSGKTVVALAALLTAVQGGYQGMMMAPTEVLAEQHYLSICELVRDLQVADAEVIGGVRPLEVSLLTGRLAAGVRARRRKRIGSGQADIVVGTHALLGDEVSAGNLGLVVVDEQHRFGVEQRLLLRSRRRAGESGPDPDLLVMTATPIPRTAALAIFGDLDTTVLDELPAGRVPVKTTWVRSAADEEAMWSRVRSEVGAGHRAFVICPLVEESERLSAKSALEEVERLSAGPLAGIQVGLLHGQMAGDVKSGTLNRFRKGDLQVLVATTVVEVGVDVPDATVIVIENAERFGLAQLHQLRGRVGRSDLASWCYLVAEATTEDAKRRLEALCETDDGFELAEIDMEIRGEGHILGTRQAGRSGFKLATLRKVDVEEVLTARQAAEEMVGDDPDQPRSPLLMDEVSLFIEGAARFLESG